MKNIQKAFREIDLLFDFTSFFGLGIFLARRKIIKNVNKQ